MKNSFEVELIHKVDGEVVCEPVNDVLERESYVDSLLTTGFDEPYDHSIDTIDPDEPPIPGPDPKTYGYNTKAPAVNAMFMSIPGMEGTMEELEDLVDGIVGEPEFLGGR